MTFTKRKFLTCTVAAIASASMMAGCSITNPYEVKDDSIDYYANIDSNEGNKSEEVYEGEDGGSSTIYRATVTLPDKKKTLEKDSEYLQYEEAIKSTDAYAEANEIKEVYPASYIDLQNNNILANMLDGNLLVSNFRYEEDSIVFTVINYAGYEIDLRDEGITVYIYDEAGYPIGVYQPDGVIPQNMGNMDFVIDLPINKYCGYIGFGTTENDYSFYMGKLTELKNYYDTLKPKSEVIDY